MLQWGHSLPALAAGVMLMAAGCQQARAQVSPPLEKRIVLAQGGSTGGSVGKRNKSISGEEESSPDAGPGCAMNRPAALATG